MKPLLSIFHETKVYLKKKLIAFSFLLLGLFSLVTINEVTGKHGW